MATNSVDKVNGFQVVSVNELLAVEFPPEDPTLTQFQNELFDHGFQTGWVAAMRAYGVTHEQSRARTKSRMRGKGANNG